MNNLIDILTERAQTNPSGQAFVCLDEQWEVSVAITYIELHSRAKEIAAFLEQHTRPNETLLLSFSNSSASIYAFFGALYSHAIPVLIDQNILDNNELNDLIVRTKIRTVLTCNDHKTSISKQLASISKQLDNTKAQSPRCVLIDDISTGSANNWQGTPSTIDDTAYLQASSGLSTNIKLCEIRHSDMLFCLEKSQIHHQFTNTTRSLQWVSQSHYSGLLFGLLQPVYTGFSAYVASPSSFLINPLMWLKAISRFAIDVSGAPNFAFDVCAEVAPSGHIDGLDLSHCRVVFSDGEAVDLAVMEKFYRMFSSYNLPRKSLCSHYGMAEYPVVAISHNILDVRNILDERETRAPIDTNNYLLARSYRCDHTDNIILVDHQLNRIHTNNDVGEIWIKTPRENMAYLGADISATAKLNAHLSDDNTCTYIRTGDRGFYSGDNINFYQDHLCHNNIVHDRQDAALAKEEISVDDTVAVIGMAGIFPQSDSCNEFWDNIKNEKNLISEIPKARWDWEEIYGEPDNVDYKTNVKWGGFVNGIDNFDASFFNISPKEAQLMDPMQRKLIEVVWKTVEDAGYKIGDLAGKKVGVFIGIGTFDYLQLMMEHGQFLHAYASTGVVHCMASNRISYLFDFTGPSEPIDTACSSSLVALHRAVASMQQHECEMAIVGGANALLSSSIYVALSNGGMLSVDGKCKTFDQSANGYVRGEGIGAVLLKPKSKALKDRDHIYGLVRGTSENHGGHQSSLTVPNPFSQSDVIVDAWQKAGVNAQSISYIEAHGTATQLGDPVEINGLKDAFHKLSDKSRTNEYQTDEPYCGIGSVKTNIGHLEAAAGIAGLVKVLKSIEHKTIPGHLHVDTLNSNINLDGSPFYLIDRTQEWKKLKNTYGEEIPRRAGISSFGFGGVNAHVVLEEYETESTIRPIKNNDYLFVLSAKTAPALEQYAEHYLAFISGCQHDISLAKLTYTLQVGREEFDHRLAFSVSSLSDLSQKLGLFLASHENLDTHNIYHAVIDEDIQTIVFCEQDEASKTLVDSVIKEKDLAALSQLWILGAEIHWPDVYADDDIGRMPLPSYPFEKVAHWIPTNTSLRKTPADKTADSIFELQWCLAPRQGGHKFVKSESQHYQFIILCDRQGLGQRFADMLTDNDLECKKIYLGECFSQSDRDEWKINPHEKSDYQRFFDEQLATDGRKNYLINFWPLDQQHDEIISAESLQTSTYFTCNTALNLLQTLNSEKTNSLVWFICSNVQGLNSAPVNLNASALWGMAKTLLLEYRDTFRAIIDIGDSDTISIANLFDDIVCYDDEGEIAYSGDARYVARLAPSNISQSRDLNIATTATYLITGGLGSLGLLAASWLSEQGAGKVLLMSRRGLDRDAERGSQRLNIIDSIEARGTQVEVISADVSNKAQLEKALAPYIDAGELRGVFHAAGAYEDNLVSEMTYASFENVTQSKVQGTWNLYDVVKTCTLDYFVLYSSGAATWGAATGAHYSAANYFLDAFSAYCEAHSFPVISVSWGGLWKDSGIIPEDKERYFRSIGVGMTAQDEGMQILASIMQSKDLRKVVAPIEWEKFLPIMNVKRRHMLFDLIAATDNQQGDNSDTGEAFKEALFTLPLAQQKKHVENQLSSVLKEILGIEETTTLAQDKGFYDLGLDSMTSIDLQGKLKKFMGANISTTALFDFNTLALLTDYLCEESYHIDTVTNSTDAPDTSDDVDSDMDDLGAFEKDDLLELLKAELDTALGV